MSARPEPKWIQANGHLGQSETPFFERSGRFRLSPSDVRLEHLSRSFLRGRRSFSLWGCSKLREMASHKFYLRWIMLQWEEVTTPASTPLQHHRPRQSPLQATASPTPGPTCAFDVTSGDCGATDSCITSPNYTENYAPDGSCVIKLASS